MAIPDFANFACIDGRRHRLQGRHADDPAEYYEGAAALAHIHLNFRHKLGPALQHGRGRVERVFEALARKIHSGQPFNSVDRKRHAALAITVLREMPLSRIHRP